MDNTQTTITLHKPAGRVLALAVLLLVVVLAMLEGGLRLAVSSGKMADPGPGTTNADLNIKLPMLDALVEREGKVDCIFLGSSMTNDDVDPVVFTQRYAELSGRQVTCFNFAVATLTGEVAGGLGRILVERYHPGLLIYGTSARDYSRVLGSRGLLDDAWFQYHLGDKRPAGWLKENSMTYKFYLRVVSFLYPGNYTYTMKVRENTTQFGHYKVHLNKTGLEGQNTIQETALNEDDFNGLRELAQVYNGTMGLVVFEAPVHPSFLAVYVNQQRPMYDTLFFNPVAKILRRRGIPLIITNAENRFTAMENEWADLKHLNQDGAIHFSGWLAEEVWALEQAGKIRWENGNAK